MKKKVRFLTKPLDYAYIMRLSSVSLAFVCIATLSVFAVNTSDAQKVLDRRINVTVEGIVLKEGLNQIARAASVKFSYTHDVALSKERIHVVARELTLKEVLENALAGLPFGFEAVNDKILIRYEPEKRRQIRTDPAHKVTASGQPSAERPVKGRVVDHNGEVLPGVNVQIKGTLQGTVTDVSGDFQLNVPEEQAVLVFSFVGFEPLERTLAGETELLIELKAAFTHLDEVVVIGYGTQKKVNLTGAVDQVSGNELQNRPITNVSRGLQGLIPNLNITNRGGSPNASGGLNLRGTTSINGGGPLVLVDNVQMDIDLLNPDDIESITVLKDAASAAIYGARGAFGVILVTLKQGAKDRKPVINYTGGMEFNKPTYLPDLLNSWEYMGATNLARQRRYGTVVYSDEQLGWAKAHFDDPANNPSYHVQPNGSIFWHANVNNFEELLQNWAPAVNHSVNINGGNKAVSYFASVGSRRQEGMFRDATDVLKRYNLLVNISAKVSDRLRVGFKTAYTNKNYNEPHRYAGKGSSWWEQMTRGVPQILFPIRTPADAPIPDAPTEHFYNFLHSGSRTVTSTEVGRYSIDAELDLIKGLKLKGDFNYQTTHVDFKDEQKEFGFIRDRWEYQYNQTTPSYIRKASDKTDYFAANAYLTYDGSVKEKHFFTGLLGFNQEWSRATGFNVIGNNLVTNSVPVLSLVTGEVIPSDSEQEWAIRGLFARLSYSYKEKYLLELNSRYDGTSRFPKDRRFQFFPSVSAGWRISEESFMTWSEPVVNDLKLRFSYGRLGNQNLANSYPYITRFGVVNPVQYLFDQGFALGLNPPGLVSPDLTWEKASTTNFGLDLVVWKNWTIAFDWYSRKTSDMLVAGEKLPAVLGVNPPDRNAAELKTRGWEFSLRYANQTNWGLSYSVAGVLSDYLSKITKFDNNPNKLWGNYYEGQTLGEIWGYETVGFFQTQQDIDNAPSHAQIAGVARQPGDILYADLNNDGVITWGDNTVTNPGDKRIIGNSTPRYQFGFTGNVSWKGMDVRLFFQGIGKRDVFPKGNFYWGQISSAGAVGTREVFYNSWTEENRDAYYPVYKQDASYNIQEQTKYLQSAAYLRLKNLSVGYTLPQTLTQKVALDRVRIFFSGENLAEWSGLRGNFDPEVVLSEEGQAGTFGQFYPLQRTLSFGLQLSF